MKQTHVYTRLIKCRTYWYITNHVFLIAVIIHTFVAYLTQRVMKTFAITLGSLYAIIVYSPFDFYKLSETNS